MQSQFENKHYVISLRKRRLKQKVKNKFFYNADDTSPTNDKNLKYSYTPIFYTFAYYCKNKCS